MKKVFSIILIAVVILTAIIPCSLAYTFEYQICADYFFFDTPLCERVELTDKDVCDYEYNHRSYASKCSAESFKEFVLCLKPEYNEAYRNYEIGYYPLFGPLDLDYVYGHQLSANTDKTIVFQIEFTKDGEKLLNMLSDIDRLYMLAWIYKSINTDYLEIVYPGNLRPVGSSDPAVYKDVNFDGEVSILDLKYFKGYLLGINERINTYAADMDGDGEITLKDYKKYKYYLMTN